MTYSKKHPGSFSGSLLHIMNVLLITGFFVGTTGCDVVEPDPPTPVPDDPKLSFFEEELVGLWSRYHRYDGSTQYIRFNADQTACKWEEASGSNRRLKASNYSRWGIDANQSASNNRYVVDVKGAGLSWTFDYPRDYVWPSSYSNLKYTRSSEGKSCE